MHESPPSSDHISQRVSIGALVFLLGCLLSSARVLMEAPAPSRLKESAAEIAKRSDLRFAALKAALPARGILGYVEDPSTTLPTDYYLTQYALIPLVIDHSPNHPLVIGNFPASPPSSASLDHLQLIKDFGNGVMLFANKDAK